MQDTPIENDSLRPQANRWWILVERGLLALLALAVLYCWGRGLTIWIAFGLYKEIWKWIAGGLVGLTLVLLLVGLAARQARRVPGTTRSGWLWAAAAAWMMAGMGTWYLVCSPFSRDPTIALGFASTTLWLLWALLMFFVPWRWSLRLGVLALSFGLVAAFLLGTHAASWDGKALPIVTWRLQRSAEPVGGAAGADATSSDDGPKGDEVTAYPRFRGADGLAAVEGANLARDWTTKKPQLRWRHPVGAGWGALAVAGDCVVTQEQRGEDECVVCYDRHSGKERWVHRDNAHYQSPGTGDGPRATPTIEGQRVVTLGATGILNCLDRDSGSAIWTTNVVTDNNASAPGHGMVGSPLIVNDIVVVCAGGTQNASLVAYDRTTGKRAWHAGSDSAGYTSPLLTTLDGVPQILIITTQNLHAHDPRSGEVLWTFPWKNDQSTNCSQPFPIGDKSLFVSADYGTGCALLNVSRGGDGKWAVEPAWSNRTMQTKFCSVVVRDGHAYSFDDEILECVAVADGRRRWKRGRYGHGQLLLADDLLVIQAEDGRVALVEATPDTFRELAEFPALTGKTWNNPALAGHQLFVRNDKEAACYELPVRAKPSPSGEGGER